MRAAGLAVAAAWVLALTQGAGAAPLEPPSGAAACTGCHAESRAVETVIPRIAGRMPADLVAAMQAFRTGAQPATVMERIVKGFTDDEIRTIADWFGAQR